MKPDLNQHFILVDTYSLDFSRLSDLNIVIQI